MDELCRIHSSFSSSSCTAATAADHGGGDHHEDGNYYIVPAAAARGIRIVNNENEEVMMMRMMMGSDISDILKAQISNHPLYPNLISSYIECRKVGAPPEMVSLLDDISKKSHQQQHPITEMGANPELDQFMESYCEALKKYKEELLKPFHEATNFLNDIESQLLLLCSKDINLTTVTTTNSTSSFTSVNHHHHDSDEAGGGVTSDDEDDDDEDVISCGEVEIGDSQESSSGGGGGAGAGTGVHQAAESELKEMLMRKYSGYLSSLRKEFLKKRKKGKLPKNARLALLDWWNTHYRWPYPTEEEKNKLSEVTGLDQRQINNWFINQRKRHWRPSEDMRFALMQGVSVTATVTQPPPPPVAVVPPVYFDTAGGHAGF